MNIIALFIFIFLPFTAYGYDTTYNPFNRNFDYIGADASADVNLVCDNGNVLKTTGSGTWACAADSVSGVLGTANGGTGDNTSAITGIPRIDVGNWTYAELSGDATTSGSNAVTISNDAITYAKMQNVSATNRILGRTTAGAGDVEEIIFSKASQDFSQDILIDDQVWVTDSATSGTPRSIPNCADIGGNHLNYTSVTNSFSCGITGGTSLSEWQFTLSPESSVLDDNNSPAITTIESTGAGTARFRVADFDSTTDEILYWTFVVPSDMAAGNWLFEILWFSNSIVANATCVWELSMSATSEADLDTLLEQVAGTSNTANEDVNTVEANRLISTTLTLSNLDSVAAGDVVTLRFNRDANNVLDDLTSDARLVAIRARIPRA